MSEDIAQRLRESVRACRAVDRSALLAEAAGEIERQRLTNDERDAIEEACDEGRWYPKDYHKIQTLRALLERTK